MDYVQIPQTNPRLPHPLFLQYNVHSNFNIPSPFPIYLARPNLNVTSSGKSFPADSAPNFHNALFIASCMRVRNICDCYSQERLCLIPQ